jgi:UDP-N-acetylmuramoyl-L-alanyl-D-glutamate--2,6-diaminopimelate ligase
MTSENLIIEVLANDLVDRVKGRFGAAIRAIHGEVANVIVKSVTHDSKSVRPGSLFVCVRGSRSDGHQHAAEAVANGAVCLLVDHFIDGLDTVVQLEVENTRDEMARIAAAFYGFPGDAMTLVGITGTNGKTTTAHTLESMLIASGKRVGVIGTLTQRRTTPEATDVQERLAELRRDGCEIVVLEVTSHALELQRVRGLVFQVAIFTNLSQDHLDFHGTIEVYFRAKAKLFTPEYAVRAVVNGDDRYGRLLFDGAEIPTERTTLADLSDLQLGPNGSTFQWSDRRFSMPIAGQFNVMNALQAATAARLLGIEFDAIATGMAATRVAGRFEPVDVGQPFAVYVDFAHTPDGLERVLGAARQTLQSGRLISVFGCGGDRDRTKRPLMAEIGARLSDVTYFTSDNPRSETVESILDDMLVGAPDQKHVHVEPDRRRAMEMAFREAKPGDVVVIAGKGHEQGQESNGVVTPFDDRMVSSELLQELGLGS